MFCRAFYEILRSNTLVWAHADSIISLVLANESQIEYVGRENFHLWLLWIGNAVERNFIALQRYPSCVVILSCRFFRLIRSEYAQGDTHRADFDVKRWYTILQVELAADRNAKVQLQFTLDALLQQDMEFAIIDNFA